MFLITVCLSCQSHVGYGLGPPHNNNGTLTENNSSDSNNLLATNNSQTLEPGDKRSASPVTKDSRIVNPIVPGADKFGIDMLYPTRMGGEEWFMNMPNPTADSRFNPQDHITKNSDGSWKIKSDKVRMYVSTTTGYNPHQITSESGLNDVASRGFMSTPRDWRDVEITGYVKLNEFSENDNFVWYTRGGKHTDSDPCQGSSYKGNLFYHGETQFAKEQWHVSYAKSPTTTATSSLEGKWIGFKFVMYNGLTPKGNLAVKLENWIDQDADGKGWKKVYEGADAGKWGRTGEECKVRADQILSWRGPLATYRWDFANDVDFKDFSVREITVDNATVKDINYFTGSSTSSNVPEFSNVQPINEQYESVQVAPDALLKGKIIGGNNNNNNNNNVNNLENRSANSGHPPAGESFGQTRITSGNMVYLIWVQGDEDNTDIFLKTSQRWRSNFW